MAEYIAPRVYIEKMQNHLDKVSAQYTRGLITAGEYQREVEQVVKNCKRSIESIKV